MQEQDLILGIKSKTNNPFLIGKLGGGIAFHPLKRRNNTMKWIIIKSKTIDKKKTEFQVSDGKIGQRTTSYDFTSFEEAKILCNQLNKSIKPSKKEK